MEQLSCTKCGALHNRVGQRYCSKCHAAYMREWRKTHPLTEDQRRKDICRSYTNVLVRRGIIKRRPCWCGARAQAHHPDYGRPRLVIWLCKKHHRQLHADYP